MVEEEEVKLGEGVEVEGEEGGDLELRLLSSHYKNSKRESTRIVNSGMAVANKCVLQHYKLIEMCVYFTGFHSEFEKPKTSRA